MGIEVPVGSEPTLRRLVLRTLLPAFTGLRPPGWARDLVAEGLAGYTLFGYNVADPAQLGTLTAALREADPRVLVALDEEGGDVTRLAHRTGSPYPGNAALGVVDEPELTERVYRAIGTDLAAVGVNLDLAPTLDVNVEDDNPIIGTRSFGADPASVAAHAVAAVTGLQSARVAACAKHFPGHGATTTDSHLELPTVDIPMSVLRDRELVPFAAAVKAGTRTVMSAHIRVPTLTGDDPATFSRAALVDLLRGELGFTGVVVSDALEMRGAVAVAGGVPEAAVRALAAGCDLLCLGARIDLALIEATVAAVLAAVAGGRLAADRLAEAADRVDALADWAAWRGPAPTPTGAAAGLGYPAALRAVRVEGELPGLADPLLLQVESASSIAAGPVPWGLGAQLAAPTRRVAGTADPAPLLALAGGRPVVVVGRNLHRLPGAPRLIEALAAGTPVVVVEMGWPSAWRPAGVRAFVTTHGASHANGWAAAYTLFPGVAPAPD